MTDKTPCFCAYNKTGRFANTSCPTHASVGKINLKKNLRGLIEPNLPEGKKWDDVVAVYATDKPLKYDVIFCSPVDTIELMVKLS